MLAQKGGDYLAEDGSLAVNSEQMDLKFSSI